jgi:hypothetical protein
MRAFAQNEPLTETELGRLDEFLKSYKGGKAALIQIDRWRTYRA